MYIAFYRQVCWVLTSFFIHLRSYCDGNKPVRPSIACVDKYKFYKLYMKCVSYCLPIEILRIQKYFNRTEGAESAMGERLV